MGALFISAMLDCKYKLYHLHAVFAYTSVILAYQILANGGRCI